MLYEHDGYRPDIHPTATVVPTATLVGRVVVGPGTRILHGAVITAQGGEVRIGAQCVIMEQAVLRGTARHPLRIGSSVLVGPRAYLCGCELDDEVFMATGTSVFNGASVGARADVRINAVVHLRTRLAPETVVPIGWIAVGDPPAILPPRDHEQIWARQQPLDFPRVVFGVERSASGKAPMAEICARYTRFLAGHERDRLVVDSGDA